MLTKEPAALLTPRSGACRPCLTKEPAALLLGAEEPAALAKHRHMPIVRKLRSLPPVRPEVREPAASHRRTRRPSAREPAAPCASPLLGACRPGFQSASDIVTRPHSKHHGRAHESSTMPAKRTHHAGTGAQRLPPGPTQEARQQPLANPLYQYP